MEATQQNTNQSTPVIYGEFGKGRYSSLGAWFYKYSQSTFNLTVSQADLIARQLMKDVGAVMARHEHNTTMTFGKISTNGQLTIKEMLSVKKVYATHSINIARAIQWSQEAFSNGVDFLATEWKLANELQKYVANVTAE